MRNLHALRSTFGRVAVRLAVCLVGLGLVASGPVRAAAPASTADAGKPAVPKVGTPHRRHRSGRAAIAGRPPSLPVPSPAPGDGPAPVPDLAQTAPVDRPQEGAEVQPKVFQLHYPSQGDGYVTGSSPQALDDRNATKETGVQLTVPLPQ